MDLLTYILSPLTAIDYRNKEAAEVSPEAMEMIHLEAHREQMARFDASEREFSRRMRGDRRSDRGARW